MTISARTIRHPADLAALSVFRLMQPRLRGAIRLESDSLDRQTLSGWETQLNRAYRACGCAEASVGTLAGLLAGAVWAGLRLAGDHGFGWRGGLMVLGIVVAATAIGKLVGLLRARTRLGMLVTEIQGKWTAEPRRFTETGCG